MDNLISCIQQSDGWLLFILNCKIPVCTVQYCMSCCQLLSLAVSNIKNSLTTKGKQLNVKKKNRCGRWVIWEVSKKKEVKTYVRAQFSSCFYFADRSTIFAWVDSAAMTRIKYVDNPVHTERQNTWWHLLSYNVKPMGIYLPNGRTCNLMSFLLGLGLRSCTFGTN